MAGTDVATYLREGPGLSALVLDDGAVYHTYSTYARGLDSPWGVLQWLDRAPKGRNGAAWWHRHDKYDTHREHGHMCAACIASTAVTVAEPNRREEFWRCSSASSEDFSERIV
jgi:hypothetical protein